jgi:two-component system, cell cycle sensor histidine kinase and response regulator CckA
MSPSDVPRRAPPPSADVGDVDFLEALASTGSGAPRVVRARALGGVRAWFGIAVLLAALPGFAVTACFALSERDENGIPLLVWSASVGVIVFLAARHIAMTRIIAPIERLSRAAGRLRAGDLAARTGAPYSAGELGRLEMSFDAMAGALEWDERKFAAADRKYRTIIENIPATLYVLQAGPAGEIGATIYMSPQIRAFAGHEPETFTSDPAAWPALVHVDDRPRVAAEFRRAVETSEPFGFDHRIVTRDGETRWLRNTGAIVRDEGGRPAFVRGFVVDVTERKNLEEQFQRAQKLEAVGRLAAGVAHDFNNLLTVIRGFSEALVDQLPEDDAGRASVDQIQAAAERAGVLTRQLLAFSRKQTLNPRILDLNALVSDAAKMMRRLVGEDVELVTSLSPALGRVRVDGAQIEHVLLNLAANARDAMPRGGRLTIATCMVAVGDTDVGQRSGARTGRYSMIAVTDTGCGMDAATRARVFEPFFTTKAPGKGTGLGLASVYGIVEQSGGHLDVESELGRGTTFRILLPEVEDSAVDAPLASCAPAPAGGGQETIVVAEDDEALRALVGKVLRSAGYSVLDAGAPTETLAVVAAHELPVHLVLADVVLPEMGGPQLVGRLRESLPDLRALYMSGHSYEALGRRGDITAETDFLPKPFTPDELRRRVREALDRSVAAAV